MAMVHGKSANLKLVLLLVLLGHEPGHKTLIWVSLYIRGTSIYKRAPIYLYIGFLYIYRGTPIYRHALPLYLREGPIYRGALPLYIRAP